MDKKRVLLCSMDGVRPDAVLGTVTPTIDRLAREGSYTWKARTVMPACTLPCHTSMLRGVPPSRHGITSNTFTPLVRPVPSVIDLARQQGKRTGFFFNWEQLRDLADPGSLHVAVVHGECNSAKSDAFLAAQASAYLETDDLDLLFLYLGWPDECGHKYGWMSPEYLESITHADACLGRVLDTLSQLGRETVTLFTSDHGGHDRTHGVDCDEDMTVPWVLHGPGIKAGFEITEPVVIYDTCTTVAHLLGLTPAPQWEGRVPDVLN
jgi:predicted AlkP superfamily pyrophosphatase or phosphodiesterase